MDFQKLIDKAEEKAGSLNKAEKAMEISAGTLSRYRSAKHAPEPAIAALLAQYVGEDTTAATLAAARENSKNIAGKAVILDLIRKHSASAKHATGALLVAGLMTFSGKADAAAFNISSFTAAPEYTLSLLRRLLARLSGRRIAKPATVLPASAYAQTAA